MAGTFSQLYVQIVFAVKGRENLIKKEFRTEVFEYIAGIIKGKDQKPIIVNGVGDHVHVFVGLRPSMSVSDLISRYQKQFFKFYQFQKICER